LVVSHEKWWKDFWAQSEITIPDQDLENLYYISYYLFGSGSRTGSYPMPLQGLWTRCDGGLPPWKGDYHHDLNTQITYMSYMRANHLDAGYSFIDYLWNLRGRYQRFAKEFHGVDGLIVPGVSDRDGNPLGGWSMYSLSPTMSIWLAKSFSDYYEFTGDETFLKEKCYPFFRDVCDAILAIMYEKDGKLYLPLSSSPEYNDAETNSFMDEWSNNDIQLVNFGFEKIIELGEKLCDDVDKFKVALTKLDKYFVNDRLVLTLDNKGNMIEQSHRHHSHIMAIYPLKTIKPVTDEDKLLIERNILHLEDLGWGQWVGFSYPWFAGASCALYHANRALFHLQMFERCFCYENGFHLNGDFRKYGVSTFHYRPFTLDANYMFCDALQEMLIQDDLGYLNLFPCIPNEWEEKTMSFSNFLCRGGFYVSATCNNSVVTEFSIKNNKQMIVKIKNNFGKQTLKFSNGQIINCNLGEIFELTVNGEVKLI
jgi:alpha-L-fucosidase 2